LLGDPSKAKERLGWQPKVTFEELVKFMVQEDLKEAEKDRLCNSAGFITHNHSE